MNAPFLQTDRVGRLTTNFGPEAVVLLRFNGEEHLNSLFEWQVEALSLQNDLDFDALVGTHATVTIEGHKGERHFDGIVTQVRWSGTTENGSRYDLVLRPWFWLTGLRRNQRIFHNKTVVEILQELWADYRDLGKPALEVELSKDYPTLEYTVQYRESDLDFARRQMERHGISYYFRHDDGNHTLVLTDDVEALPNLGAREYKGYDGHHQPDGEHFWSWTPERNLTTGAVRLTDFNFKTPMAAMEADRAGDAAYTQGRIESFDYPGDYLDRGQGKGVAALRIDQERGGDRRQRAAGDCVSLGAGMRVKLDGDPVPGTGETYLCLTASYNFVSEAYGSGAPTQDGYAFSGAWTLMPSSAPLAPPRRTAAPVVQGPQTAMVVGEGEIDCDEHGRILVRFHWDLHDAYSMRCRVSQNWAGAGWGGMVIPRIGMEVVVEFLEGDPDKPLVTGCVYNGKNKPPYDLPANKTRSTFRTDTHDGKGFNELRFEDKRGAEEIYLHGQRDLNFLTNNDSASIVRGNRMDKIFGDEVRATNGSRRHHIAGASEETILGNLSISVGNQQRSQRLMNAGRYFDHAPQSGELTVFPGFKRDMRAGQGHGDQGSFHIETEGGFVVDAKKGVELRANHGFDLNTQQDIDLQTTSKLSMSGATGVSMDTAQVMSLSAGQTLTLGCGQARIVLHASGAIVLDGTSISKLATGVVRSKANRIEDN
ncbi:type VI secretion system tip protein TssI/VgrG [Paracoccus sp. (in: a-proteobacteria)]|uniref:type VI secretion system Vgr family protein n=1 Tax=Paracoccus sp. TaxID=267 RepID=UPI002898B9AD|nr:type VI secretion system tip protein TssI/VgrG [Paracoccus sp. (in: a-proteobacteria)]